MTTTEQNGDSPLRAANAGGPADVARGTVPVLFGPTQCSPQVAEHLRKAARLRFLSLAFECPREGWQEQLDSLAAEIAEDDLRRVARLAREEASPELYHTTFGPGGPAAPREISYSDTIVSGQLIAELQAFYEAFAYRPTVEEPPDHIAVELGYLGYLHLKIAYAAANDDEGRADVAADAAKRFAESHLANILGPLIPILEACGIGYLEAAAASLRSVQVPSAGREPE